LIKSVGAEGHQIPTLAFAMFQLTFAIITVALLSGAIADRAKYGSWVLFVAAWVTLVYIPVAHWAFAAKAATVVGSSTNSERLILQVEQLLKLTPVQQPLLLQLF
jgi:ammonia channel protein AmtB